jgi:hypothetical protein
MEGELYATIQSAVYMERIHPQEARAAKPALISVPQKASYQSPLKEYLPAEYGRKEAELSGCR